MTHYPTPAKLKAASAEVNADAIRKRQDFAQFMQETGVHDVIMKHLATRDGVNGIGTNIYFIGGSQAWKEWAASSIPASVSLTPMERSALVAGNTDVFYLSDSEQGCDTLMCDLHEYMAKNIIAECDMRLKPYGYKVTVDCYGFTPSKRQCTFEDPKTTYTMFPAYSMMFHLAKTKTRHTAAVKSDDSFDGKLVLYLEVCHVPRLDVNKFASTYVEQHSGMFYLNIVGLVTFAMLISQNRASSKGGIDVDRLRNDIVAKMYPMVDVYDRVHDTYHHVFHQCPSVYTESIVNTMRIEAMKARSANVNALSDAFEQWLMEKLRPCVNAFIKTTADEIAAATKHHAFMFVVGGDAMRRYKKSISVTKDIDTKVYIPPSNAKVRKAAIDIVKKNMSSLVTYLIRQKGHIFSDQPTGDIGFTNVDNGVKANIKFMTNNPMNVQFRLREIKKSATLPVDLYSIDYRAYLQGTYRGVKFNVKYDIPILDVAIQENKHKKSMSEVVHVTKHSMPVASLDFLLHDIQNTYGNDVLVAQRIVAKKRGKDADRFYKLRQMYMERMTTGGVSLPSSPHQVMGIHVKLDAIDPAATAFISSFDDPIAQKYLQHFESLHTKARNIYKFKMPFDSTLLKFSLPTIQVHQYAEDNIALSKSSSMRTVDMEDVASPPRRRNSPRSMSVS